MDDKKKRFVIPEAEIVDFSADDIITISSLDRAVEWTEGEDF